MSDKTFFTFPLCLLAMPLPEEQRLDRIICFSISKAGRSQSIEDARVDAYVASKELTDYDESEDHQHAVKGAITCNVQIKSIKWTVDSYRKADAFKADYEGVHGPDASVFVSTSLYWYCKEGKLSFRLFSTLCAINSICSYKTTPVLIRRDMIAARQLGYKSPAVMQTELKKKRALPQVPLTTQQLRDTLDTLEESDLIKRCSYGQSNTYYSTVLTYEQLKAAVDEIRKKTSKIKERRNHERTMKEPKETPVSLVQVAPKAADEEPKKNQSETIDGTEGGTIDGTNVINVFKEMSFSKCLSERESTVSLSVSEILREAMKGPEPKPKPSFNPPANATEVITFAATLTDDPSEDIALEWFTDHGVDPKWITADYRQVFASHLMRTITAIKRQNRIQTLTSQI